jgi:alkylation response protein AidB-like acyl-CoA dehydrogenase
VTAPAQSRAVFTEPQERFRETVRAFLNEQVVPEYPVWVREGRPSRRFWEGAAELGILGIGVPEVYGGLPGSDFRHSAVVTEEIQAQERLSIAVNSQAAASAALSWTVDHVRGTGLGQDAKFALAQCATEVAAGQALIDQAMLRHVSDRLSGSDAAMAKLYCTELQGRVVDRCLNLWDPSDALRGDSHIGNAYLDGRVSRIYGGSSEIMKVIIGQGLGL